MIENAITPRNKTTRYWIGAVSVLIILVVAFLLGVYGYRGVFSRYLQDDYCYSAQVVTMGFFRAQIFSYMHAMPYNSDRFSLTLFSGIAELLGGPRFVPFLAGISIAAWVSALFFLLSQWARTIQEQIPPLVRLAAAGGIVFFTFYLAPNLYQVLYWRSAMFPYLTPLILHTFLVGWFVYLARHKRLNALHGIGLGLASLVSGGFSETAGVYQLAVWGLLFIFFIVHRPRNSFALKLVLIPIVGTLLAIGIMAMGPGNSDQLSPFQRPDLLTLLTKPFIFARDYMRMTVRSLILPFFVIGCLGLFVGFQSQGHKITFKRALLVWIGLLALCYLSIVAEMFPTMLAMSSYPGERALLPASFSLILAVFGSGWLAARYLGSWPAWARRAVLTPIVVVVLGLALTAYLARIIPGSLEGMSALQHRAEAWDARNALILTDKAEGQDHVKVPAFTSIGQILELYPEESFWVNVCAAQYYGISGISAIEGYNGVKPYFK